MSQQDDDLRPHLTDEFLATLVLAAKAHGGDLTELAMFVRECFRAADKGPTAEAAAFLKDPRAE